MRRKWNTQKLICVDEMGVYFKAMIAQTDIRQMSLPEKLALFEALWTEMSFEPEHIEIPQWHKDILDERLQAAELGEVEVIDWEIAKEQIRDMIR